MMLVTVVAFAKGKTLRNLVYCGIVGICDPPRPFVREAIQTLTQGGVKVKLVTGDAQETAIAIGEYRYLKLHLPYTKIEIMQN